MANYIIVAILLVIAVLAIRGSASHFRGEGGCCGGSAAPKVKKKRLAGKVIKTYVIRIEGMHCENCAAAVMQALNDIDGVSAAVSLGRKQVRAACDRPVDKEIPVRAIEQKGYKVISVEER